MYYTVLDCSSYVLSTLLIFFYFLFLDKGKKVLCLGALPCMNLPQKAHQKDIVSPRRPLIRLDPPPKQQ